MATPRLEPDRVYDVADQLPLSPAEIDAAVWDGCLDARHRSTLSRAYYSVFLSLKLRIVEAALTKDPFPEHDVHAVLFRAVREALGSSHRLTRKLSALRADRRHADYDLDMDLDRERTESRLDDAHDAIADIAALSQSDLIRIVRKLSGV